MRAGAKQVFKLSIPVAMGYLPFGAIFGVLWTRLGHPWYFATLIALFVLAGSAQFLLITLLARAATPTEIFVATALLNLRHMFYGLSIAPLISKMPFYKQLYMAFAMTDETYAVVSHAGTHDKRFRDTEYLAVAGLHHFYWVLGCTLGALVGQNVLIEFKGLEFVLTALFMVLLIEQVRLMPDKRALIVPLLIGLISCYFFPQQMLLMAIASSIAWILLTNRRVGEA